MKNYTVVWNKTASACLDEITYYIALDNIDRAFSFRDELINEAEKIKEFPESGSPRIIGDEPVRTKVYKKYCISYRIVDSEIIIVYIHKENIPHL